MELASDGGEPALDVDDVLDHVFEKQSDQASQLAWIDPLIDDDNIWWAFRHVQVRTVLCLQAPVQRDAGPFSSSGCMTPGYAGRARWSAPDDRAVVQATAFLNRGDRDIHGKEYAWETDFRWLSVETAPPAGLRLLGEWGAVRADLRFVF